MIKIAVVVSSHLESLTKNFLKNWEKEFIQNEVTVYLNEDNPQKTFKLPKTSFKVLHFSWDDHRKDLGKNHWIISRKTSSGKAFCFWKAYMDNMDVIISIDHDCYPDQKNTIKKYLQLLETPVTFGWITSVGTPTRGFPYKIREATEVVLAHGGWSNIPDFDGSQMLQYPKIKFQPFIDEAKVIPKGTYFPLCGMNFAFKRFATPALYFLLMGEESGWPFDRFDDIWAGVFFKKISDHLGFAITSGGPSVRHEKATDSFVAIKKEANGLEVNEWLWQEVDKINLTKKTFKGCYIELAEKLKKSKIVSTSKYKGYFDKLSEAMIIWANLF